MLKSKLTVAVLAALAFGCSYRLAVAAPQVASTAPEPSPDTETAKARRLEAVTVTGSLIPQSQVETSTPVITLTADEMRARGFATVADAPQQSSFATGSVQGSARSASFTQGAQTLSLFGLNPGYVKYLIDGRPMGDFPALYNGSDAFNNLSSIPAEMVDHIDILSGGQSSIYGSDAIAGVINIVLKKKLDAPVADVRYGWHADGGGANRRIYLADSFNMGKLNVMAGVQYQSMQPTWGFDRGVTSQFYSQGTSPATASRDFLVNSSTQVRNSYVDPRLLDPSGCANITSLFHGTEDLQYRNNSGYYCGSLYSPGYKTMSNDQQTANLYTHATFDVSDDLQFYGDLLYNYDEQKYSTGSSYTWWGTSLDYGAFYDPKLDDFVNLQHAFGPEEVGGYPSIMNKNTENSYMLTLGAKGTFGQSLWDYDFGFTHSDDQLTTRSFVRWADAIDGYFENKVLGPNLGPDPYGYGYSTFAPNYGAFFQPVPVADFRSFTGYTTTRAKTWDNMLRSQVTNTALFALPGGDAGLALCWKAVTRAGITPLMLGFSMAMSGARPTSRAPATARAMR